MARPLAPHAERLLGLGKEALPGVLMELLDSAEMGDVTSALLKLKDAVTKSSKASPALARMLMARVPPATRSKVEAASGMEWTEAAAALESVAR